MKNDVSKMIRRELRQAHLVWMMDVLAQVFQHCASKGWKSFAAFGDPHLCEAQKEAPFWR